MPEQFIRRLRKKLSNYKWRAKRGLSRCIAALDFHFNFVWPGVFEDPSFFTPDSFWLRDDKGLKLDRDGPNWRLTASFESDIEDQAALDVIKRSIEDYWTGPVTMGGKRMQLKVVVLIKQVTHFSEEALRIEEGPYSKAMQGHAIYLARRFDYGTPAHEFGHMLHIPDEYNVGIDAKTRERVIGINRGSLMSWHETGIVQESHRRAAILNIQEARRVSAIIKARRRAPIVGLGVSTSHDVGS